jgi:hypothetical protein
VGFRPSPLEDLEMNREIQFCEDRSRQRVSASHSRPVDWLGGAMVARERPCARSADALRVDRMCLFDDSFQGVGTQGCLVRAEKDPRFIFYASLSPEEW